MGKLIIWDNEGLPPKSDNIFVLWSNYEIYDIKNQVSISRLVEENADLLRKNFLSWVCALGETQVDNKSVIDHLALHPGFSYWWMSLLAEKCNFSKSPQIDDAVKLFAFDMWASKITYIDEIELVSSRKSLADCLKMWCDRRKIKFFLTEIQEGKQKHISLFRTLFNKLPYSFQALIWLLRAIKQRWNLRGVGLQEWINSDAKITFVSYLANLESGPLSENRFESRYWTALIPSMRAQRIKTNWLHLYVKDPLISSTSKASQALMGFNNNKNNLQNHVMLDSFLSLAVIIAIIKDWVKVWIRSHGLEKVISKTEIDQVPLWPLFKEDWKHSIIGKTAMSNSWHMNLFKCAVQYLPKQKYCIYLQENMDWEYPFLWSWKQQEHGLVFGFPHSTTRFWDLRYFFDPRSYQQNRSNPMPIPDKVCVNGPLVKENLENAGYPVEKLENVEALRYLYLIDMFEKLKNVPSSGKSVKTILVLGDFEVDVNTILIQFLKTAALSLPSSIQIIVKPHPLSPISIEQLNGLNITLVNDSIETLLLQTDVAYGGSMTTALVETYLMGIPTISLLNNDKLNFSPLRNKPGMIFISSAQELQKALVNTLTFGNNLHYTQAIFHLNKELPLWKKVLLA